MRRLVWVVLWSSMLTSCEARESTPPEPAAAGASAPTMLDRWNDLMRKAQEHAGAIKDYGRPRKAPHHGKPAIVLRSDDIVVEGKPVELGPGSSLNAWKQAIPGTPRCDGDGRRVLCNWDEVGIRLLAASESGEVIQADIYLNIQPPDPYIDKQSRTHLPKQPFAGNLELDGYGIDAETKFWEIRKMADPKRNLRCGLRDCSHPHGAFSSKASLYLRLNRNDEYGTVYELSIAGDDDSPNDPMK